jgi:YidC/Oxa1 family membrane protein insertase
MDRKSIIVIAGCIVMLGLWSFVIVPKLYPPKPLPPGATSSPAASQQPASPANPNANATPVEPATTAVPVVANPNAAEELLVLTNETSRYTFTSYGGGLKLVELTGYPESIALRHEKSSPQFRPASLNSQAPAPTLALLDGPAVQGDGIFSLTKTASGVRAEKALTNGLLLVKDFSLSSNYVVNASVRLENHSALPLNLPAQDWVVGTATPMSAQDKDWMTSVTVMWDDGARAASVGVPFFNTNTSTLGIFPRVPKTEYRAGNTNVVWVSAQNQYFALVVAPKTPAPALTVRMVDLPPPSREELLNVARTIAAPKGLAATLNYPAQTLAPGQAVEQNFTVFAGPKEYRTLAHVAARFNNGIDRVMGFTIWGSETLGFFSKGLLLGMNWLHDALHFSYGWAIVGITIIIKVIFWPLTAASTRSMKRMQAVAPELKELQAKYKSDPQKLSQEQWKLYKKHKVNPMGGCLPMIIQIPVFIGFLNMIRSAIELRGAKFLWVADLSKPDTLFAIPGINFPFNLLPLIMGGTMLWQTHLAPPTPGVDPAQQKMMRYMPLMFLVFLYNYSAGMALYWTVNNLLTIAQTKLTKTQPAPAAAPVLTGPPKKKK